MGILSTKDAIKQISPPASVKTGKLESNSTIYLFQEQVNLPLKRNISVDISSEGNYPRDSLISETIFKDTPVNSYFLHFDRNGSTSKVKEVSGSVTFNEDILGLIVFKNNHNATRGILGNSSTIYAEKNAKLEFSNKDTISWYGRTVTVNLRTYYTIDQVRVITASSSSVSVPPTVTPTLTSFIINGSSSSNLTISEGISVWASVSATDPDQESISFFLNGSSIGTDAKKSGTRSKSTSLAFPDNGIFTYTAQARDENGKSSSSITRTVTVNNIAPAFSLHLSSNVINEGQSASASLLAADPGADAISFFLNGSFISTDFRRSGTRSANRNLGIFQDNGTFTYSAQARDDDGANSNTTSQTLTVINVAPNLSFRLSSNVINEGQSASAILSATDPGADAISFYLDNQLISTDFRTSGTRSANRDLGIFQDDGVFRFSARSRDDDGGNSNSITQTLTVNNVAPTITSLTQDFIIRIDKTFSFAATATDPGLTDILVYEWDLDGDGQYDDFTGSSGEWSFSEPGNHEVKLRVSDGDGGFDYDSFTVTAEENLVKPYSFRFTDIKAVSDDPEGNEFQFSFEIINWSDTPAAGIQIAIHEDTNQVQIYEPLEFAGATVDSNRDPITGNLNLPNNSTVSESDNTSIKWNLGDPLLNRDLLGPATNERACQLVPGCDLLSGEPRMSDIEAIDNGDNVRDGFVFTVDNWDEGEILILNWFLLDENGNNIGTADAGNQNGYGLVQFYRQGLIENNNPDASFGVPGFIDRGELFHDDVYRVTESI